MTIVFKREEIVGKFGTTLVVEQYADKPNFVKFWRWFINGSKCGDLLMSKPNVKRLKEMYL